MRFSTPMSHRRKRYIFVKIVFILIVSYATVVWAAGPDFNVAGAGLSAANGCYVDSGIGGYVAGTEWWVFGDYAIYTAGIVGVDTYCRIGSSADPENTQYYYKRLTIEYGAVACSTTNGPGGTWVNDTGGNPVPTVTDTTCTSPAGPSFLGLMRAFWIF